ncbi:polyhydroxyalkanoate synthase [Nocardia sp. GAS34]|uniref:PHA/PHB synthase family protein n=1 Tax=unclassified Nocardia TaxID=2637762 RepID=UPI003D2635DE
MATKTENTDDMLGADELAAPLDLLLTGSAVGIGRRLMPNNSWGRLALELARRPGVVGTRVSALGRELVDIARGQSQVAPARSDKRFADPAWQGNPLLRRAMQAYLAAGDTAETLLTDAQLDWRDEEWMRFVVDNAIDALAPTNNPLLNPVAWKAAIDTGGSSMVQGVRHFLGDMAGAPRIPAMVEANAFTVGENVAVTAGSVVLRTEAFELIQYQPSTEQVRTVPLLMVPPVINKFYVMDIAPGRSMIEYFLSQGQQVFAMSWRNPDAAQRDWGFDTYGGAILDALAAVQRITGSERTHLQASCSGGILAAMTAAHLAAIGQEQRLASLTLMVTVLDQSHAGFADAVLDEETAHLAIAASARKGYLDGAALAEMFAWLRPNDLVWRYWVNNYLQGRQPAPFDVLFWNADATRMTAALHRDMVMLGLHNALTVPDAASMLGTPVDLSRVSVDSYVVAGLTDHISPWQACYRSARLLGSKDSRFVLSTSGHIAALVNPPGNPKSAYRIGATDEADPGAWADSAAQHQGSWWTDFTDWLGERSGPMRDAPAALGLPELPPLAPAPGTYVLAH